jgi:hypothetical protein
MEGAFRSRPGRACTVELAILGMNATTLGIPCVYYGSEQRFDGRFPSDFNPACDPKDKADRYIRETMFGGTASAYTGAGTGTSSTRHRHLTLSGLRSWPFEPKTLQSAAAVSICGLFPRTGSPSGTRAGSARGGLPPWWREVGSHRTGGSCVPSTPTWKRQGQCG